MSAHEGTVLFRMQDSMSQFMGHDHFLKNIIQIAVDVDTFMSFQIFVVSRNSSKRAEKHFYVQVICYHKRIIGTAQSDTATDDA